MKTKLSIIVLSGILTALMALVVFAEAKAPVPQTTCPVMGGKIDTNQYVDVDGRRVYVCCESCIDKIKADPGKYIGLLDQQGVTVETASAAKKACAMKGAKAEGMKCRADGDTCPCACCTKSEGKVKTGSAATAEPVKMAAAAVASTGSETTAAVSAGGTCGDCCGDASAACCTDCGTAGSESCCVDCCSNAGASCRAAEADGGCADCCGGSCGTAMNE